MDSQKTLLTEETSPLTGRLSQDRFIQPEPTKAQWFLYGDNVTPDVFEQMDRLTGKTNYIVRLWRVGRYDVVLMDGELTSQHQDVLNQYQIDYALTADLPDLNQPGLLLMDMDSTAIQIECIDEIAKLAGVGEEVAAVTERAMQGELDFEQSLRQRVGKLAGADASILEQVRSQLPLMPELEALVVALKAHHWKVAIASGGFTYFSDYLKTLLSLDFAQSNVFEIEQGKLTGHVIGSIVSAQTKADILVQLANEYKIPRENTVAIGDGANDLTMMGEAGLGIAYHAKPKVEALAQSAIRYSHLGGVMCILSVGIRLQ
ncbi:Phosphoserine phosphatase [Vibrio aerogenes CECT 7868]|uniref:Phosphoserine phosphatase n=1 Tax=Vibrio aerogenes CECT 7868 TaxID=1216006 RepID=A0A1M5WME1_9VIBR|nr:phosphoserine phosphatase [Vibrio aerogenes]SHH88735.1 Phosphoserine phosphatase [Vibrio aerogenes CECT 7868]